MQRRAKEYIIYISKQKLRICMMHNSLSIFNVIIKMKEPMFTCSVQGCDKAYCNKFNLKRHIESSHMGLKRFQCQHCCKFLSSRQNLKEHLYTHTGEKPYRCREAGCEMAFRQGSQLSVHKRIHFAIKLLSGVTEVQAPKVNST